MAFSGCFYHRLQSDTDKWRPLLVDKFWTWFAAKPLRFWPLKKISFRIVKIMNNFCIFNNLQSCYLMIVDNFFLVHFFLSFTFFSPQHFGQCQTGACGFYAKMLTLNIFDEFLSFFKSQLYLIWKAIKINCIVKIWSFLRNQNVKCTFLIQIGPQCTCVVLYRRRQSAQISVKLGNNSILSKKSFFCG